MFYNLRRCCCFMNQLIPFFLEPNCIWLYNANTLHLFVTEGLLASCRECLFHLTIVLFRVTWKVSDEPGMKILKISCVTHVVEDTRFEQVDASLFTDYVLDLDLLLWTANFCPLRISFYYEWLTTPFFSLYIISFKKRIFKINYIYLCKP